MQEPQADQVGSEPKKEEDAPGFLPNEAPERKFPFQIPANWKRLSEKEEIWIDNQEKLVIVSGRICLNRGLLEMFACPKGMKEHESVVATYPIAMYVHQALLLVGANPGRTVQWEPEYKPAEGPKVQIECWFYDEKNELVKRNAKEMVKLVSDGSPLKIDWVFGGSKFIVDPDGRELYAANGGELSFSHDRPSNLQYRRSWRFAVRGEFRKNPAARYARLVGAQTGNTGNWRESW
jgi:hypothetical protein